MHFGPGLVRLAAVSKLRLLRRFERRRFRLKLVARNLLSDGITSCLSVLSLTTSGTLQGPSVFMWSFDHWSRTKEKSYRDLGSFLANSG